MNIITQKVTTWGYCPNTLSETIKWIERAARVCYQSQDKIDDNSADKMVSMLINKEHTAMIEHSWLGIKILSDKYTDVPRCILQNNFIKVCDIEYGVYCVGNYRAWMNFLKDVHIPQPWDDDLDLFSRLQEILFDFINNIYEIPIKFVNNEDLPISLRAITVNFITSRDVTHELVRHRPFMAYAQKSQRYCADKVDVDFVLPTWAVAELDIMGDISEKTGNTMDWLQSMRLAEEAYHELLKTLSPQEARVVLPNSCSTEIVVTAPVWQWETVENLRTSSAAYPAIRQLIGASQAQRLDLILHTEEGIGNDEQD